MQMETPRFDDFRQLLFVFMLLACLTSYKPISRRLGIWRSSHAPFSCLDKDCATTQTEALLYAKSEYCTLVSPAAASYGVRLSTAKQNLGFLPFPTLYLA